MFYMRALYRGGSRLEVLLTKAPPLQVRIPGFCAKILSVVYALSKHDARILTPLEYLLRN